MNVSYVSFRVALMFSLGLGALFPVAQASPLDRIGEELTDVSLRDLDGQTVNLLDSHTEKVLVIAYTALGCPISSRYTPRLAKLSKKWKKKGVRFVGINASPQDKPLEIKAEMKALGINFPVFQDYEQALTKQLDAKTTTVVFVVDKNRVIRYRGMIDDQYALGAQRKKPRNKYLERAIRSTLRGKEVHVSRTAAPGCLITRLEQDTPATQITYSSHIASIIQENCQSCHRPQQIAPFALTSYESVRGWSAMIHSVVKGNRMPPWNAAKEFDGHFLNQRNLSDDDKKMLLAWIDNGMPRGIPEEDPPTKHWPQRWRIGKPDKIFMMKKGFSVPAEGTVDYQYFSIPTNFKEDKWIKAIEARAGAQDVVHHILVFVLDPNKQMDRSKIGLEDGFLCATVPGDTPSFFPEGYAKKVPAGSTLVFQMHYTTNGKRRMDRSSVGFVFADKPVENEMKTRGVYSLNFEIPAGDSNHEVRSEHTFKKDTTIFSFFPHMHFRGKSWQYIAHMPDGSQKTLLSVPKYDFNWQESYILEKPVLLPAGTKLECIAHFDNSAANFANPDPDSPVRWGEQTWEEMMIGYIDYVEPTS